MLQNSIALQHRKLNAAGLAPEVSRALPEREAENDEVAVLKAVYELYNATPNETTFDAFSQDVVLTMPNGEVVAGLSSLKSRFQSIWETSRYRTLTQRLLTTPATLAHRTMLIDQSVCTYAAGITSKDAHETQPEKIAQNLVVVKRSAQDGRIVSVCEEHDHMKAPAPLAARAAAASNFYSPTDNMVSPITSKLNKAKARHFTKAKPTSLFASTASSSPASNAAPPSGAARRPSRLAQSDDTGDMSF